MFNCFCLCINRVRMYFCIQSFLEVLGVAIESFLKFINMKELCTSEVHISLTLNYGMLFQLML